MNEEAVSQVPAESTWGAPSPTGGIVVAPSAVPTHAAGTGEYVGPWARLGANLLEGLLMVVTLFIGWVIWAAMTAGEGQTPAKRILGHQVVDAGSLVPVGMGRMFWMRGLIAGFVVSFAVPLTIGILLLMPFWDGRNQNLWDKVSSTVVVRH